MSKIAARQHNALLQALGDAVIWHSSWKDKPLCVDLALPNPPRLRVYMYSLVGGIGTVRPHEFKAVLRLRGQPVNEYASFDQSGSRFTLLVGYHEELDVFVLWDASLHPRFKNGTNIQVRDTTVLSAAAVGRAEQRRPLTSGVIEIVIACQTWNLTEAISDRVAWTGGFDLNDE
ncbi:hypothetical protein [Streptosporangium sandarakinum]